MAGDWIINFIVYLFLSDGQQCGNDFALANYYADYMVLQRAPAHARIWGYSSNVLDEVTLTINLDGQDWVYHAVATEGTRTAGRAIWSIELDPISAGGPYNITVVNSQGCILTLNDVLFGDLWFCSGQSNMVFPLHEIDQANEALADVVNYSNVRIFQTALTTSNEPQEDVPAPSINWSIPNPDNARTFSAVCWLYGRNLYRKYKRPIGLVQSAWKATRIEAWSSPDALLVCFPDGTSSYKGSKKPYKESSSLYNSMVYPFFRMPIYGAIWYQGEANVQNYQFYGCAIQQMVRQWRTMWHTKTPSMDPVFPFGVVQLAPNDSSHTDRSFPGERWSQTHGYGYLPNPALPRFFMAVAIDTPDLQCPNGSIHPRFKIPVADRLSLASFAVAYGDTSEGLWQGPIPTGYDLQKDQLTIITLSKGDVELEIRDMVTAIHYEVCCASSPNTTCPADAENDNRIKWTNTTFLSVKDGRVTVRVPCHTNEYIVAIRYAWRENPCPILLQCPIYSKDNSLPAPPFYYSDLIR